MNEVTIILKHFMYYFTTPIDIFHVFKGYFTTRDKNSISCNYVVMQNDAMLAKIFLPFENARIVAEFTNVLHTVSFFIIDSPSLNFNTTEALFWSLFSIVWWMVKYLSHQFRKIPSTWSSKILASLQLQGNYLT